MVTTKSLLTKALLVFVALLSLTTTLALSATHKAHVHGQAELTVAIDIGAHTQWARSHRSKRFTAINLLLLEIFYHVKDSYYSTNPI